MYELVASLSVASVARAADLVEPLRGLPPDPPVEVHAAVEDAAQEQDHLAQRKFDHAAGVAVGGVEDRHPAAAARLEVDMFRPDAECTDGQKIRGALQEVCGHAGFRADAENGDPPDLLGEHLPGGAVRHPLHGMPGRREDRPASG